MIELRCTNIRVKGGHRVVCNRLLATVDEALARLLDDKHALTVYCEKCQKQVAIVPHAGLRDGGMVRGPRDQVAV